MLLICQKHLEVTMWLAIKNILIVRNILYSNDDLRRDEWKTHPALRIFSYLGDMVRWVKSSMSTSSNHLRVQGFYNVAKTKYLRYTTTVAFLYLHDIFSTRLSWYPLKKCEYSGRSLWFLQFDTARLTYSIHLRVQGFLKFRKDEVSEMAFLYLNDIFSVCTCLSLYPLKKCEYLGRSLWFLQFDAARSKTVLFGLRVTLAVFRCYRGILNSI